MDKINVIVCLLIFAVGTLIGVSLTRYFSNKWHKEEIMVYKDELELMRNMYMNNDRDYLYKNLCDMVSEEKNNFKKKVVAIRRRE